MDELRWLVEYSDLREPPRGAYGHKPAPWAFAYGRTGRQLGCVTDADLAAPVPPRYKPLEPLETYKPLDGLVKRLGARYQLRKKKEPFLKVNIALNKKITHRMGVKLAKLAKEAKVAEERIQGKALAAQRMALECGVELWEVVMAGRATRRFKMHPVY